MPDIHRFTNKELIQILKEVLAAMEVKGFNFFRIRAYQNAIGAIESLTSSVYDYWQNKRLDEIPGVGEGLSTHLNELFTTGSVKEFQMIKSGLPEGMFSLIGLRSIGAKRAFKLAKHFSLNSRTDAVEKLKSAAENGLIRQMEGFGEKSEKEILNAINDEKMTKNEKPRLLLIKAEEIANRICEYMRRCPDLVDITPLGSLRRRQSTVGDLDLAAVSENTQSVIDFFLKYLEIEEVLVKGDKKAAVVLTNDTQVDLRVSTPKAYGAMVQYGTGNKQHNVLLRTYALEQGKSLSEYGIKYQGKLHEFPDEESFYAFIGLPLIPAELRQGKNEIDLAQKKKLPTLVTLKDIRGDLHTHTIASDGVNTLAEMVMAAKEIGYEYIGIADHAPSIQSRGYEEVVEIIEKQRKAIDAMNSAQKEIKVLLGYEVNILADCTLALPDELLKKLDYVIASVHTAFNQDRENMTERVVKALENPYVTILGHPSGRLINERTPIDVDWHRVFSAALDNNKVLEINGHPSRLDLGEDLVLDAIKRGLKLIVNTDAHDTSGLNYMKYGVDVARRGFCEKKHLINTLPLNELLKEIKLGG